jgi:rfaE bifunctional protein nucleotidyltransferase chain/domain
MERKILDANALVHVLSRERQQGSRLVVTNGCFDVLHVGHLRYLQAAQALGDKLIVLLNTDRSVKAIKGELRPINSQSDRAEMLAGLSCVDYIAFFDEPSPVGLLEQIKPDVYVKGGDYTVENLPEAPALQAIGTDIQFIPLVQGRSTTGVIERILQAYQPA